MFDKFLYFCGVNIDVGEYLFLLCKHKKLYTIKIKKFNAQLKRETIEACKKRGEVTLFDF
jgi:hypothetical protein